jgi:hypothetical protein
MRKTVTHLRFTFILTLALMLLIGLMFARNISGQEKPALTKEQAEALIQDEMEIKLYQHLGVYIFRKHGCPIKDDGHLSTPIDAADCHPGSAKEEYAEFLKAKKIAMQLWNLKDAQ